MLMRCQAMVVVALLVGIAVFDSPGQELPPVPAGVEVQARGPIHEAYASLTADPVPTKGVPKAPPNAIEELPPAEKPDGDVVWISGYWAWDEDRSDFLWVSGVWRKLPPGRQWVAGYWRQDGTDWQWVPGFWATAAKQEEDQQITYLPAPPIAPDVAPPGKPPTTDSFYVPGSWVWTGGRYAWRAGYWARVQPGYVWVPDHYRWTPSGYVYVVGYWDLALKNRGILYAPVYISPAVVTVGFTYTPAYAVRDTVVVEALFVRPTACHYYFGDYYAPAYRTYGYESCVVYSSRRYDSIIVYETYERRDPTWLNVQVNLYNDRCSGRAPCPPRTLVQQTQVINNTTIVNNNTTIVNNVNNTKVVNNNVNNINMIAPTQQVAATKNTNLVKLDDTTRNQARTQAANVQQVAKQRVNTEVPTPPGASRQARVAALNVPKTEPVKPGMTVPKVQPTASPKTPPAGAAAAKLDRPNQPAASNKDSKGVIAKDAKATVSTPPAAGKTTPVKPNGQKTPANANPVQPAAKWVPAVPTTKPGSPAPAAGKRPPAKDDKKEKKKDSK